MNGAGGTFDAIAIGFAVAGVLVAIAMHVVRTFNSGSGWLPESLQSRAQTQRAALLAGEYSPYWRFAGALAIAVLVLALACAIASKKQIF